MPGSMSTFYCVSVSSTSASLLSIFSVSLGVFLSLLLSVPLLSPCLCLSRYFLSRFLYKHVFEFLSLPVPPLV